jgi:uncharacterized membrane protein
LNSKRTDALLEKAGRAQDRGARLRRDRTFRRELEAAVEHGRRALRRAHEVDSRRSHKLRTALLLLAGGGTAAAAASGDVRTKIGPLIDDARATTSGSAVIQETLEVEVPVATAYNQWTQFEDFPRFMDGVDDVRQLDDTRLHWVASIGGRRVEWDAKILEQHPDRQISWASEDGRKTRGTVSFEPLGDTRTLVTLSMSYRLENVRERIGSAAGLDRRRVRGDLERFKELIEGRGSETGGWRGDISGGEASAR